MCNNEFPLTAEWSYYLLERSPRDDDQDVLFAWRFDNQRVALEKLAEEAAAHNDRTYQIFKSID